MKSATRIVLIAAALGLRLAGEPAIEFAGVAWSEGSPRFVLCEPAEKKTSAFLALNSEWNGWTLVAYDAAIDVLTVRRAGREEKLSLRVAKTTDAAAAAPRFRLLSGRFEKLDGKIVFSPDARLAFKSGDEEGVASATSGVLVADEAMTKVEGNLLVETSSQAVECVSAKLLMERNNFILRGKTMRIRKVADPAKQSGTKNATP